MDDILLSLRNVDIRFGKVTAVRNASVDIRKGEILALVGESGSGKSTIGRAIVGIHPCASGEILYKGEPISRSRQMKQKINNNCTFIASTTLIFKFRNTYTIITPLPAKSNINPVSKCMCLPFFL